MADPQRLLSNGSDADALERELLGSIQRLDPPEGAKGDAWARLSAQITAVALVTTAHGSAAAASAASSAAAGTSAGASVGFAPFALKALGSKLVLGLAVASAGLGATAIWVHYQRAPAQVAHAPTVMLNASHPVAAARPVAETVEPASAPPIETPLPASEPTRAVTTPGEMPVKSSVDQSRKDQLSAESALLTQARAELRNGNAAAAQQSLNRLRTQFPKGMLGQEREVLAIEVLAAQGNTSAARSRAKAFIAVYPKSPHSAQLSRFADAP